MFQIVFNTMLESTGVGIMVRTTATEINHYNFENFTIQFLDLDYQPMELKLTVDDFNQIVFECEDKLYSMRYEYDDRDVTEIIECGGSYDAD